MPIKPKEVKPQKSEFGMEAPSSQPTPRQIMEQAKRQSQKPKRKRK